MVYSFPFLSYYILEKTKAVKKDGSVVAGSNKYMATKGLLKRVLGVMRMFYTLIIDSGGYTNLHGC